MLIPPSTCVVVRDAVKEGSTAEESGVVRDVASAEITN
jgi:hypothetical protein